MRLNMVRATKRSIPVFLLFFCALGLAQGSEKREDEKKHPPTTSQAVDEETTQIGNSYFQKKQGQANTKIISQLGVAYEAHRRFSEGYAFFNQYFPNQIFYELRLVAISHNLRPTPLKPPLVPFVIPQSEERRVNGYGGIGIFGYNFVGSSILSLMPFARLHAISNTSLAYDDIYGNRIRSGNYGAYLGGRLSIQLSNPLAFYTQCYGGYQWSALSGAGVYTTKRRAVIHSAPSFFEFGTPFRINTAWSITPYVQLIYSPNRPNHTARDKPYRIETRTVQESLYAIKLGYAF